MQLSFIDLDGLKRINDEYGHEMGDEIIATAASILQSESDRYSVARYGGDEFIVIGTARDESELEEYWERVQKRIEEYNRKQPTAHLSMSFGYDIFKVGSKTTLEECIQISDKKMYVEKRKKKEKK
jgi:diguanylate cyclase (GGDEF)-like protein